MQFREPVFKQEGRGEEGLCPCVLHFKCEEWENDTNSNGDVNKHIYLKWPAFSDRCDIKTMLFSARCFCTNSFQISACNFPEKSNYAAR